MCGVFISRSCGGEGQRPIVILEGGGGEGARERRRWGLNGDWAERA